MKDDDYMTVGDMRKAILGMPNSAKVYYQRIEDVYFDKHGWTPDKLTKDDRYADASDEWLRAWCGFKAKDGDLHITAHY